MHSKNKQTNTQTQTKQKNTKTHTHTHTPHTHTHTRHTNLPVTHHYSADALTKTTPTNNNSHQRPAQQNMKHSPWYEAHKSSDFT